MLATLGTWMAAHLSDVVPLSLRERKAAMTRARLVEVSRRLFSAQGYDGTTLEQIAEQAVVSVPTVLAYFESKERLALAQSYESFEALRQRVEDPHRVEGTLALWRQEVAEGTERAQSDTGRFLRYRRFQISSSSLLRANLVLLDNYVDTLGHGLAEDFHTDFETDLPTRLLATMLVWGHDQVLRHWAAQRGRNDLRSAALAVVDFAIEQFPKSEQRLPQSTSSPTAR
jgi:AcrR family transcriptional regulator